MVWVPSFVETAMHGLNLHWIRNRSKMEQTYKYPTTHYFYIVLLVPRKSDELKSRFFYYYEQ